MPYILVENSKRSRCYVNTDFISFIRQETATKVTIGLSGGPGCIEVKNAQVDDVMDWVRSANQEDVIAGVRS